MKVRSATAADLDTVRELWEALYEEWPQSEYRRAGWNDIVRYVEEHIETNVVLIAEQDGVSAGFALAWPDDRAGFVSDLYVRPEFRRRGIARALLAEVAARMGTKFLTLTTTSRNGPARRYYAGLGFREASVNLVIESERLA
jgi:ribosomal protein S18 acetylase RimI-like enzyme